MDAVLLIARVMLAGVFALSGVTKLVDRTGSRQAMIDFGVPGRLAGPMGRLLPVAELLVAFSLLFVATAWWAAVAATTLLVIFTIGMVGNLVRGRTPDCHCFGELHSQPIGPRTLARNAVLIGVAGIVVWQGHAGMGIGSLLAGFTAMQWLVGVGGLIALLLIAVMAWLLVSLWRQQGRMLTRIEALERATRAAPARAPAAADTTRAAAAPAVTAVAGRAPDFALAGVAGPDLGLSDLLSRGKPVLLVFSDSGCGPCNELLPLIGRWQREHATWLSVVLISRGRLDDLRTKAASHGLVDVLQEEAFAVSRAYGARGTPSAVLVRADGTIGGPAISGPDAITAFVAGLVRETRDAPGARGGSAAPDVQVATIDGRQVALHDLIARETLVLFWNPGCGFCQRMLPDLRALEAEPAERVHRILVVSTGGAEANLAMGLRSPVVLDDRFATGRAFGVRGTPSGVVVDADRKIASPIAVGSVEIMKLARSVPVLG